MGQANAKIEQKQTPLEDLSTLLADDMAAVNDVITNCMQSDVKLIPQLAEYLISAGGKRIRPLLTLATTRLYDGDMDKAYKLAAAVEFIHTATLLHDDVVDESEQRRGKKAANLVFGNQASVLVGDFLFSRAFQLMTEVGSLDILNTLSTASAIIAEGEVMQLMTTGNLETTFDQYIQVINAKTAALFSAACEVGPKLANDDPQTAQAMAAYGTNIGIAFQIADDALDYSADQESLGKTIGDDFREGKMTAPVLLALQDASAGEQEFWNRTLVRLKQEEHDLHHAQTIIERLDAVAQSLDLAHSYGQKAKDALTNAPDHKIKDLLFEIVDYTINRRT